ncbi:MAG TPA: hypothetical protein VD930_12630 [Gemmatimonadales bacterium]|nr:hypothetical protein [Gemmatimonadales bacterium]
MTSVQPFRWSRLYKAAALAGALAGLAVVLGLFPATPPQVTAWIRNFDNELAALTATMLAGAIVGLLLTAVAHLGVSWQLRRRS